MRILHVNKFLFRSGGAEGYMFDLVELQRAAGHEVAFYGMRDDRNEAMPYADTFAPHATLDPMPDSARVRAVTAGRMVWNRASARGIEQVLDDFRPEVVHLHNIYHQLSPSVLRPIARRDIPAVMTLHDYKLVCPTYLMLDRGSPCDACVGGHFSQAIRRRCKGGSLVTSTLLATELAIHTRLRAYGAVDVFVCPSRFMLDTMTRGGVFPDRLRHLPHFAAASGAASPGPASPGPGATDSDPVVVFAGRLSEEKAPDLVVRAAAHLSPELRVEIAGAGLMRPALEQLADQVAPGRVTFLGHLSKHDLHERVRTARVVVVPSRCHENQPMSILEAYGLGTPVVATRLGGIPELVVDGVTGVVVEPEDPAALAAGIAEVAGSVRRAREMGAAGRDLVRANFRPDVHLAGLDALYREAGAGGTVAARTDVAP